MWDVIHSICCQYLLKPLEISSTISASSTMGLTENVKLNVVSNVLLTVITMHSYRHAVNRILNTFHCNQLTCSDCENVIQIK